MTAPLDLELDPLSLDLVDAGDGGAVEADDSRTAVLLQLTERRGAGWLDEGTGSRIAELLEREEPSTADDLRDAALEALQLLVDNGAIAELAVTVQPAGKPTEAVLALSYTDVASGRRVPLLLVPFGGTTR